MIKSSITFIAAALLSAGSAQAAFTGDFAASQWASAITSGGNGSVVFATDGSALTLTSSNHEAFSSLIAADVSSAITLKNDTSLSFNWSYVSNDENGSTSDPFGYSINGAFVQLSANDSWDPQSGNVSLNLSKGNTFAFVSRSTDSIFGASVATLTSFNAVSATPAVPEPSGLALAAAGLVAVSVISRRRSTR